MTLVRRCCRSRHESRSQVIGVVPFRHKVRGWHFNCAFVIYGVCRASPTKLFETQTKFIGLEWSPGSGRCSGSRVS